MDAKLIENGEAGCRLTKGRRTVDRVASHLTKGLAFGVVALVVGHVGAGGGNLFEGGVRHEFGDDALYRNPGPTPELDELDVAGVPLWQVVGDDLGRFV